jgi:hypothetical protein
MKDGEDFLIWSTIVDAPITEAMTKEALYEWFEDEYGYSKDNPHLKGALERAEKTGTSAGGETPEMVISCNRAGHDETFLPYEEIWRRAREQRG